MSLFLRQAIALALVLAILGAPSVAVAATLTKEQVDAVISVLTSFGVDAATVTSVRAALTGTTQSQEASTSITASSPTCTTLSQTLKTGSTDRTSRGEVSVLQDFLDVTKTGTFDPETRAALETFQVVQGVLGQNATAQDGLGIVGPLTRAAIKKVCEQYPKVTLADSAVASSSVAIPAAARKVPGPVLLPLDYKAPPGVNPNSINADHFRAAVKTVGLKQGYSAEQLKIVDDAIAKEIASTTDFRSLFYKQLYGESADTHDRSPSTVFKQGVAELLGFFSPFSPETANALIGLPFGTRYNYFTMPCLCSATFLQFMMPLPPYYAVLLVYTPVSITHAFYTAALPTPKAELGQFIFGGICLLPAVPTCIYVPNEGTITRVGSTLI